MPAAVAAVYRAEIRVELKSGVADPEGANTMKALELLGFRGVKAVRAVHAYAVELDATDEATARREVESMCRRLLTNPVIHDYRISLEKA